MRDTLTNGLLVAEAWCVSKSRSIMSFSGAYWARWSAGWGAFLALIVIMPEGPSETALAKFASSQFQAHQALVAKLETARAANAGAMVVRLTTFDLSAEASPEFADIESAEGPNN
jgi:hypothetical protein